MNREAKREHWRGLIAGQASSGQSVRGWCAANGIRESQYYAWKRRLADEGASVGPSAQAGFVPVDLACAAALVVRVGRDVQVEVGPGCDGVLLRTALEALRGPGRCWR